MIDKRLHLFESASGYWGSQVDLYQRHLSGENLECTVRFEVALVIQSSPTGLKGTDSEVKGTWAMGKNLFSYAHDQDAPKK